MHGWLHNWGWIELWSVVRTGADQCAPANAARNTPVNGVRIEVRNGVQTGAQNVLMTVDQVADQIVVRIAEVTADADASSAAAKASNADIRVDTLRSAVPGQLFQPFLGGHAVQ